MCAATAQTGYCTRSWIHKNARAVHHCGILRRGKRHLDYVNPKQSGVGIFFRCSTRASGQLLVLTNERSSRHIDIDVVLIIRIDDQSMRVRAATGLHGSDLLRTLDVTDVENSHSSETIFLRGR